MAQLVELMDWDRGRQCGPAVGEGLRWEHYSLLVNLSHFIFKYLFLVFKVEELDRLVTEMAGFKQYVFSFLFIWRGGAVEQSIKRGIFCKASGSLARLGAMRVMFPVWSEE